MEVLERYTPSARWFHWLIVAVFLELVLSGLLLFLPWLSSSVVGAIIKLIHRIGAVSLVGAPLIFSLFSWPKGWYFVKEAFTWGKEDFQWMIAAPVYYFGGNPKLMPPQGYINTGMKLYRIAIIFGGLAFATTGMIMWFFKGMVSPAVFQWALLIHDITFIAAICMFMLHLALGIFHPRMDESLLAIIDGKVSGVYAKSHHQRWHDEMSQEKGG